MRKLLAACFASFTAVAAGAAEKNPAADYPSRPIRFVVPLQAGGANDLTARIVAQKLTERWGRQVVPDNRPGAAGSLGVDATARATPDGHTIAIISASHAVNSAVSPKLPYDLTKDLQAISQVSSLFYMVTLHPAVRFAADGSTPVGGQQAGGFRRAPHERGREMAPAREGDRAADGVTAGNRRSPRGAYSLHNCGLRAEA